MKKILAILLCLVLAIAFTMAIGCKKAEEQKPAEAPAPAAPEQAPAQPAPAQPAPAQPAQPGK